MRQYRLIRAGSLRNWDGDHFAGPLLLQVDPCRPGGMRFRDPFAQRLPRALRSTPPSSERLEDGLSSPPASEVSDANGDEEIADLEDAATPQRWIRTLAVARAAGVQHQRLIESASVTREGWV